MKFKLLDGSHVGSARVDENGQTHDIVHDAGDVFESNIDLVARFNQPGFPPKFLRVPDETPVSKAGGKSATKSRTMPQPTDVLEQMTVEELKAHAAEEEIDLGKARSRDQIIAAIREAMAEQESATS